MRFRKLFRFSLTFAAVASFACALQMSAPQSDGALERVLTQMDNTAAKFHTTQANFIWNQYSKVVDETDIQKGKVYLDRKSTRLNSSHQIISYAVFCLKK